MSAALREVLRTDDPAHAHLVAGFLDSHGIRALVVGDDHPWANGSVLAHEMRAAVHVAEGDAERALALVAEIEATRSRGAHWTCPGCELFVGDELVTCPACTTLRPPRRARP